MPAQSDIYENSFESDLMNLDREATYPIHRIPCIYPTRTHMFYWFFSSAVDILILSTILQVFQFYF